MSDAMTNISGAATIFITSTGTDDTRPLITLPSYTEIFYEDDTSIPIVSPLATIIDVNDRFYLIQSLEVILTDTRDNGFESISVQNLSSIFTSAYDTGTLTLTITGPGTSENYTSILRNIVYMNTKPEPTTRERLFFITAHDTVQASNLVIQSLSVVNTNDVPIITLAREQVVFIENSIAVVLDGSITLSDEDTDSAIQNATIQLLAVDTSEVISFPVVTGNIIAINNSYLVIGTDLSTETVQQILRVVTYTHLSDDPTAGSRTIRFTITDERDAVTSVDFTVIVEPVNDKPVVTLSRTLLNYPEDSSPVLIGDIITLSDVDSTNFTRIVFRITDIPNVYFPGDELVFDGTPNLLLTKTTDFFNNMYILIFRLENNRPISDYQSVVNTVRYTNTIEQDFLEVAGDRMITITVYDLEGAASEPVLLLIEVTVVNDPPLLDIGNGLGANWTFDFTEFNSSSMDDPANEVHIVLQPFLDIYDEENDAIISLTVRLTVSNGELDPNEFLFIRSIDLPLFDNTTNIQFYSTGDYMAFYGVAPNLNYTDILRGIYYTNDEDEPGLFPLGNRFILITITDARGAASSVYSIINTIPVNDNKPVVYIRLHPGQTEILERTRREIPAFDKLNLTISITIRIPFSESRLKPCDTIDIKFEDEMDQINLSHRRQLETLLHFNHEVYNELPKYSYWADAKTLTIIFPRIDDSFIPKITEIQKFNLSIIFKDCSLPYDKCTNLCAKKSPLACAKGENKIVPIFFNPKLNFVPLHPNPPVFSSTFLWSILVAIVGTVVFFVFVCIKTYFKARKSTITEQTKNINIKQIQPKSDPEKIPTQTRKKLNQIKSNPRATPNILKCNLDEN